ncbi:mycofactocin precursor [Streptomyces sp. Ru73]|nr:mycofactocin precursor MftA [Streptomyces sp. Ru73]POX38534.1 mycofactocin precursor [Streptomyces sp. Ru73]
MHEDARTTEPVTAAESAAPEDGIVEEVLVEEVSIDGMCGVY